MPPRKAGVITVAISPDADDAFMLYALENNLVATEGRTYEIVRGEVARLNEEAKRGTYDVTAFSFGSWPHLVDRYLVLPAGASLGDGVGPVVVSKTPVRSNEVNGLVVGVPGLTTTGALVLRMWLHPAQLKLVALPFEAVPLAVRAAQVRAGVLIHEAQLTYRSQGMVLVKDLGAWWTERTEGLPLPLGGMLVRRDIPQDERTKINLDLKRSIAYAMGHRADALAHAMRFAKGLTTEQLERYIDNYVNELSLDIGERGRQAVHTLFREAQRLGMVREVVELEMA
jgi:1,4-dihydroxy-6-naphthoate synthase